MDHDTAAFAVESIRRWWNSMGQAVYPNASRLLITADSGGSNGSRVRLWKVELQKLADETGLRTAVSYLPPGASKWSAIERCLFSLISQNWRGKPLISHEIMVNLIAATTTRAGITVRSELDTDVYPPGIKVSDMEVAAIDIRRDKLRGDWNYTLRPRPTPPSAWVIFLRTLMPGGAGTVNDSGAGEKDQTASASWYHVRV